MWLARPICFTWLRHAVLQARCFARLNAGNNMPARMAMIAITTKSSINVKALLCNCAFMPRLCVPTDANDSGKLTAYRTESGDGKTKRREISLRASGAGERKDDAER